MKVMFESLRNPMVASLIPGVIATISGAMSMGIWAFVVGVGYAVAYFLIYVLVSKLLKPSTLIKSVITHALLSALVSFVLVLAVLTIFEFKVGASFYTALNFAVLALVGGFYLGYINKTS